MNFDLSAGLGKSFSGHLTIREPIAQYSIKSLPEYYRSNALLEWHPQLQADAAALQKLTGKGLSLRDAFGRKSTARGRDVITNLHRTSFATKSGAYTRLRRLAQAEGLVL